MYTKDELTRIEISSNVKSHIIRGEYCKSREFGRCPYLNSNWTGNNNCLVFVEQITEDLSKIVLCKQFVTGNYE